MSESGHVNPRVSYVLCTLNRAGFIEKALANVRAYISSCDELIVADGGSTDGTLEILEKNRDIISVLLRGPDKGEAHALNRCILAARGKYIKFITDDDEFDPVVMETSIDYLDGHPSVDGLYVGGTSIIVREDGSTEFRWTFCLPEGITFRDRVGTSTALQVCGLGFILCREAFAVAGLFDVGKKYVDVELMARLLRSPLNVRYLDRHLFQHNLGPQSTAWRIDEDELCKLEFLEGFIRLRDWKTVSSYASADIMRVTGLPSDLPGVKPAIEVMRLALRSPSRVLGVLLNTILLFKHPVRWMKGGLAKLPGRVADPESVSASIVKRQLSASKDPCHSWNGQVW